MKNNRGLTLASLIIYIIALFILIGTMSTLTKYFYKNFDSITVSDSIAKSYSSLNNYLSNDINSSDVENAFVSVEGDMLTLNLNGLI